MFAVSFHFGNAPFSLIAHNCSEPYGSSSYGSPQLKVCYANSGLPSLASFFRTRSAAKCFGLL
jgi:hypothetical protein